MFDLGSIRAFLEMDRRMKALAHSDHLSALHDGPWRRFRRSDLQVGGRRPRSAQTVQDCRGDAAPISIGRTRQPEALVPHATSPPSCTNSRVKYIAGNRYFSAKSTMRFLSLKNIGLVNPLVICRECVLDIVGTARFDEFHLEFQSP
jgi:hypothetical protein